MEAQLKKWVNLSFLAAAALVSIILFSFSTKMASTYDIETRVKNIDMVIRIGSLLLGLATFIFLSLYEKASSFMHDVVLELSRVTWPTVKDTRGATFIVIITVVIGGMILGFFDYIWTVLIRWVL